MIDIHTHILPDIDDGARNKEQSHEILKMLYAQQVRRVVFTPHFYWDTKTVELFLDNRKRAYESLSFPEMQTYLGAEVEFGELKIDYSLFSNLKIGDTRYILLELPFTATWGQRLFDNLRALCHEANVVPIIAHIELYPAVLKKPRYVKELLSLGCLLQVNADSLINVKKHSFVDVLLKYGQVQAIGSDSHNLSSRKPNYALAIESVQENYGLSCVNYLQYCMQTILEDRRIFVPYFHNIKRFFGFYR